MAKPASLYGVFPIQQPLYREMLIESYLQGKVRDTYDLGNKLLIVTTDRQSAFDRLLAAIPFKVCSRTTCIWVSKGLFLPLTHGTLESLFTLA